MKQRLFILLFLLPGFLFITSCTDTAKDRAALALARIFAPEDYKLYKATVALKDYIISKTKLNEDIVFLYSDSVYENWLSQFDDSSWPNIPFDEMQPFLEMIPDAVADGDPYLPLAKEGQDVYSGIYQCALSDKPVVFIYRFSAIVQKGEVKQFNVKENDSDVLVFDMEKGEFESKDEYELRVFGERIKQSWNNFINGLLG